MPRRIVIAPDSFKGTLSARDAAAAIAEGWAAEHPEDRLQLLPQADGGEGTLDALAAAVPAARWQSTPARGPLGEPRTARWLLLPSAHAVIELAECCGITLLPRAADGEVALAPLDASSHGAGDAIAAALDAGARQVTLALGGSASTDGGLGALSALGLQLLDSTGAVLPPGGGALARLARIDPTELRAMPPDGIELLADTAAVLTGPNGAAALFGPQKGADPEQIALLDRALAQAAAIAGGEAHLVPGAGAAGGTAWGFLRFWGAGIRSGADAIAAITGLDAALDSADLVITGEGRYDATSATGKVVGRLAERAAATGVPLAVIAGQVDDAASPPAPDSPAPLSLVALAGSTGAALREPERWLRLAARQLARAHRE